MTATTQRFVPTGVDPSETVIDLRDGRPPTASAPAQSPAPRARMTYLPALDGLRAIAVIAVLLYHADVSWAPGGFLGVDVFFVLSGYLITTILLESASRLGTPDLRRFYVRRARRLLPALFAVLIGSTILVITIAPDEAANQQRDLPAALMYVTNWVYVLTDQSYFEATGRPPMLQHLWSLAVEEQFYLLWPWLLIMAWRLGGTARVRKVAGIGALASTGLMLALSVINGYPADGDPSRAYFGTDTHAMGLLTGAVLATLWIPRRVRADLEPGARLVVDASGAVALVLVLLVFGICSFDSSFLYHGGFLLLSLLVAVLVAASTHPASRVGLLLGSAPMRYLGTRSYGLYLWHWPIFLVTRPGLDVPLTGFANFALRMALTIGVAELSYRFLELPIRRDGFAGAWAGFLAWLSRGPAAAVALSRRPAAIAAIAAVVLAGLTIRLYTLPAQADSLDGVTSLSALQPDADGAVPQPTPSPTVPTVAPGVLGLGESVMIGAGGALTRTFPGITLDASVGRQEDVLVERVAQLAATSALREQVIVHTGTNGPLSAAKLRTLLSTLQDTGVDQIVVVNDSVPRRWQDANNAILLSVVAEYPAAILVDWHAAVLNDPALVNADGIHPSKTGVEVYASLIEEAFATLEANLQAS